jgi:hypothetical protein
MNRTTILDAMEKKVEAVYSANADYHKGYDDAAIADAGLAVYEAQR